MKVDVGAVVTRPTKKEVKLLEKVSKKVRLIGRREPNICISVYKNRGGKYNQVKIWLHIDYDTMRVHDLFVTDYNYEIQRIPQSFVRIDENENIQVFRDKDMVYKDKIRKLAEVADIVDDGEIDNSFEDINKDSKDIKEDIRLENINKKKTEVRKQEDSELGLDDDDDDLLPDVKPRKKKNLTQKENLTPEGTTGKVKTVDFIQSDDFNF